MALTLQEKMNMEGSIIRAELKKLTTKQIEEEYKELCVKEPNSNRTTLFNMELSTRILLQNRKKSR